MPTVTQINESTNPECFYLENDETVGVYDIPSREIDWIDGAIRSLVKKVYDGVMIFSLMSDHIEVYWRRDSDLNPVKVAEMYLYGRVFYNDAWVDQSFNFDVTDDAVDLTVVEQGVRYWILWTVTAFGGRTNYMGMDWTFTKGSIENQFFLFAPELDVEIRLHVDVRNAALKVNRSDGRGLSVPEEATTVIEDSPSTGWTRHEYIYSRDACETADSRTPVQLFNQDAGLSVRV